tara:strand:- start:1518 stop:2687 length:1170 start_codon:yes stop_codon:yes gene_type:complete
MNDKDLYGIFLVAIFFALAFIWLILNYVIGILERYNKNKSTYYNLKKSKTLPSKTLLPLSQKLRDSVTDHNSNKYGDFYISDYVIFSSFNSAAGGTYQNDWVDEDILVNMIDTGARLLDFEIYSINDKAVIAVNDTASCRETGSFNHLPLDTVLKRVNERAFQGSNNDPLFLQFRLKTSNKNVLEQLEYGVKKYFNHRLLPKFTGNNRKNINNVKLKDLINKVVIVANDSYCGEKILEKSNFYDNIVNMSNNDTDTVSYRSENDIVSEADKKQLIKDSRAKTIIVIPDQMKKGMHLNFNQTDFHTKYGIQIVLRNLSYSKENHVQYVKKYMNDFYDHPHQCAFRLKPAEFRREILKVKPGDVSGQPAGSLDQKAKKFNEMMNSVGLTIS